MRIKSGVFFFASILLIVGFICPAQIKAKILPPSLGDLIKNSDCIVEGKVTGISEVRGVRIAHLEVTRIHKGSRSIKRVNIWTSKTWACDISYAELNESGLYFLTSSDRRNLDGEPPEFAEEVDRGLGGGRLYSITWSGYGRLINNGDGRLQSNNLVKFPRTVSVRNIPKGDYSSITLVDARDVAWVIYTMRLPSS